MGTRTRGGFTAHQLIPLRLGVLREIFYFRLTAAALNRSSEMRIFGATICAGGKFVRRMLMRGFCFSG